MRVEALEVYVNLKVSNFEEVDEFKRKRRKEERRMEEEVAARGPNSKNKLVEE